MQIEKSILNSTAHTQKIVAFAQMSPYGDNWGASKLDADPFGEYLEKRKKQFGGEMLCPPPIDQQRCDPCPLRGVAGGNQNA